MPLECENPLYLYLAHGCFTGGIKIGLTYNPDIKHDNNPREPCTVMCVSPEFNPGVATALESRIHATIRKHYEPGWGGYYLTLPLEKAVALFELAVLTQ